MEINKNDNTKHVMKRALGEGASMNSGLMARLPALAKVKLDRQRRRSYQALFERQHLRPVFLDHLEYPPTAARHTR